MKTYFLDTNLLLRYLLGDNEVQLTKIKKFFKQAQHQQIKFKISSPVIPELEYVMRKVYSIPRQKIADTLISLLKTEILNFEQRSLWIETFDFYSKVNADPVDIFIFLQSRHENAQVLTFDQDFIKISRTYRSLHQS
jgi:predicted nucleic-acid-binding protein